MRKLANASDKGKGGDHEESVGGNALQDVDVLVFEATAEFQLVPSTHPTQRSTVIVDILKAITRAGDGVAYCRISIDLDKRRTHRNIKTGLVGKAKIGWRSVVGAFTEEEFIAQEGEAQNADQRRIESVGFLGDEVLCPMTLADRESRYARSRGRERIKTRVVTDHVAEVQGVVDRQIVVYSQPSLVRILALGLGGIEGVGSTVRQREKSSKDFVKTGSGKAVATD